MRRAIVILLLSAGLLAQAGLRERAGRAFAAGEWPSAQALYMLVSDADPDDAIPYGRTIVAALMHGDTTVTTGRIEAAMSHGVPLDSVLGVIGAESMALGQGAMYARELHRLEAGLPYLRRPVEARLLHYYSFRRDADNIIRYASALLRGMPDNAIWLNSLADGYLLAGDTGAAIATWRRTLEAEPYNVEALICLGNALLPVDRDEALPFLIRANEIAPSDYLKQIISGEKLR